MINNQSKANFRGDGGGEERMGVAHKGWWWRGEGGCGAQGVVVERRGWVWCTSGRQKERVGVAHKLWPRGEGASVVTHG